MDTSELNKFQMAFNRDLGLFMKSPGGDAGALVEKYRQLRAAVLPAHPRQVVHVPRVFDYARLRQKSFAYGVMKEMKDRASAISKYIQSFIVHGSFATEDFVEGWSDLDTMIVLNDQTFASAADLSRVKAAFLPMSLLCYFIDPLAHHELFFITQFDLDYYPQIFLPLAVYREGMVLTGAHELSFCVREDIAERHQKENRLRERLRRVVEANRWDLNTYEWKFVLADAMLMPSYLLQEVGIYVYKRESFEKMQERFPGIDLGPMNEATAVMRHWQGRNWVRFLPYGTARLPYRYARKIIFLARGPSLRARPAESPADMERLTKLLYDRYVAHRYS